MGEMAAQLAHEIRNPLVSIGATLEMLGNEEGLDGEVKEILAGLAGEVQRLDTLLKDYLSLAVRRNTLVTKVDLSAVLDDAVRLLGDNAMKGGGKTVTNLLPRGSFEVLADYDAMRHVVLNLVRNALEAVGEGGKVECGAERSGGEIKLYVDDNGPGLSHPPDECFKSFFTTKRSGTGLGLTICLKIVSAYGGTIRLGNRPGGGCRATVSLPGRVQG
jgi:signal transduction histidine kinase